MHNVLNKAHNGVSTCYYLLKQAMKDNGTLLEEEEDGATGGKETVSKAALKSSKAAKSVRPMSAPSHKVIRPAAMTRTRTNSGGGDSSAADSFIKEDKEDSFIKEDTGGSVAGGL